MNRHQARETAFKIIFQLEAGDIPIEDAKMHALEGRAASDFCLELVDGVLENRAELDEIISARLHQWTLERMAKMDRSLLRLALYEMLYIEDVPTTVTINEAVELAKTYGDDESSKFVNGLLSNVAKEQ
ncbi:transcription antitermination factor NusB [Bacillaceae bacterium SIJ1]|uniref:transcription antitermination factor NusB n=1 Tax=Litoribacterium kuwaitense TaxID=1398745 RepID=UPI0013EA0738|nr:transcription antitermination factor NusB [Litoribacterium kuwaitense]NGP43608.1 transcription antitermination factor NusB [Litoribacterium kuwaitense]